jgi:hypothetical protein
MKPSFLQKVPTIVTDFDRRHRNRDRQPQKTCSFMSDNVCQAFLACTRGDLALLQSLVPSVVSPDQAVSFFFPDLSMELCGRRVPPCRASPRRRGLLPSRMHRLPDPLRGELNRSRREPVLRLQEQIDLMKRIPLHYGNKRKWPDNLFVWGWQDVEIVEKLFAQNWGWPNKLFAQNWRWLYNLFVWN